MIDLNNNKQCNLVSKITSYALENKDKIALHYENETFSYGTLENISNSFAYSFSEYGIKKGASIGVCLPRGPNLIFTIFGLWKIGALYIPIDANYPSDRINSIIEQSQIKVIITDKDKLNKIKNDNNIKYYLIETQIESLDPAHSVEFNTDIDSNQAACAIFTSGTTGYPKGIIIEHGHLYEIISSSCNLFQLNENDASPLLGSISFDASLYDLLLPLYSGGHCLILDDFCRLEPEYVKKWLSKVTFIHCTPSLMQFFTSIIEKYDLLLPNIKLVLLGGEAVSPELVQDLKRRIPNIKVYVVYGPSEVTILGTFYDYNAPNVM